MYYFIRVIYKCIIVCNNDYCHISYECIVVIEDFKIYCCSHVPYKGCCSYNIYIIRYL